MRYIYLISAMIAINVILIVCALISTLSFKVKCILLCLETVPDVFFVIYSLKLSTLVENMQDKYLLKDLNSL